MTDLEDALLRGSERVPLRGIQKLEGVDEMQKLSVHGHPDSVGGDRPLAAVSPTTTTTVRMVLMPRQPSVCPSVRPLKSSPSRAGHIDYNKNSDSDESPAHLPDSSTDSLSIAVLPSTAKQWLGSSLWIAPSLQATIFPNRVSDTPSFLNTQL